MSDIRKANALIALNPKLLGKVGVKDGVITLHDDTLKLPSDSDINDKIAELDVSEPLAELRGERNTKLAQSDWTQNRDVTLSNDADWKTYRQSLRDITKTYKTLDTVKWPTEPTS